TQTVLNSLAFIDLPCNNKTRSSLLSKIALASRFVDEDGQTGRHHHCGSVSYLPTSRELVRYSIEKCGKYAENTQAVPERSMRSTVQLVLILILCCLQARIAWPQFGPPPAPMHEVVDNYFGREFRDPYRYMEEGTPEATEWIRAQG